MVSKGGNLLLDLPPQPDACARPLEEIGRWLRVNGESIFGTSQSPFDRMPFFGRATSKGNVLYLHLYQWRGNGRLPVPGLRNKIVSAEMLAGKQKLAVSGTTLDLPASGADPAATVIKLTLDGPPRAEPYVIQPDDNGVITATVAACEFETKAGQEVRKDDRNGRPILTHWTRAIDVPSWKVRVPRDGRYLVEMRYAANQMSAGVLYTVTMRGPTMGMVKGIVEATGAGGRQVRVSDTELEAGDYTVFIQPENKQGQPAMALEAVVLRRIGD